MIVISRIQFDLPANRNGGVTTKKPCTLPKGAEYPLFFVILDTEAFIAPLDPLFSEVLRKELVSRTPVQTFKKYLY